VTEFCKEKDFEVCAIKLHLISCITCVIIIYRYPCNNCSYFLKNLESVLKLIWCNSIDLIVCGDLNINYLNDNYRKQLLDSLTVSYCLYSTVQFPIRILDNSYSAVDKIFICKFKKDDYTVYPLVNGLSNHDALIIIIYNITTQNYMNYFYISRNTDKFSVLDFKIKISYESWTNVFTDDDVNTMFNNFLNTHLRIFYCSFPVRKMHYKSTTKVRLTSGIKTSCQNKRRFFLININNNDPKLNYHYKK
jgi:hypothetical protein